MRIFRRLNDFVKQSINNIQEEITQLYYSIAKYITGAITRYFREKKISISEKFKRSFGAKIAIDLGTANIIIGITRGLFILNEPSFIMARRDEEKIRVVEIGNKAIELIGRTAGDVKIIKPIKYGAALDFFLVESMLKKFITKAVKINKYLLFDSSAIVAIPAQMAPEEKKIIKQAVVSSGIRDVMLVEQQMAAAVGIGLPVSTPTGSMVINIGGSAIEIFVISLNGIVLYHKIPAAGHLMDELIVNLAKRKYNLIITEKTAEMAKIKLCSIFPLEKELVADIIGRDTTRGHPKIITLTSLEIRRLFKDIFRRLVFHTKEIIEKIPPELSGDIFDSGAFLYGGGSRILGVNELLTRNCKIKFQTVKDSTHLTLNGIKKIAENKEIYTKLFM